MVREKQIASTNASPLPSTFEWIWTTDKKPTSFRDWLADSEPVFWIQGKPGSGKSTLMDYLSTNNRVSQLLGTSGAEWTSIRFFFDFRSGTDIANTFEGLLRSLLLQMVKTVPGLETGLGQSSAKSYVPEHITKWDSRSLQDAFYRALAEFPTALCLFIDGLDEYGGQMFELVRFFFSISERCGPRARHKVCLASRPEEILAFGLEGCPGVRMQDHNTKGIEKYVRNMLDSRILPDEQDRDTFSELVAGKAEGVFLWARFAVSEVISSFSRGENLDELNRRLDEVPLEMNEIYYKIFGRMSPSDRHDARLMFQLVCFAKGSSVLSNGLTILQLKEAVDVANNRTVDPAHESRPSELQKFRRALRAKSGGLLEDVSESEEKLKNGRGDRGGSLVRLTHRTVKSYLDQEGWLLESQIENGSFSPHALWLYICCKHVQSILGPSKSRPRYTCADGRVPPDFLDPSMKHSLIQYASYSLFYHARYLERLSGESSYEHLSLVSSSLWMYLRDKCRPWKCYRLGDPDWDTIGRNPDIQPWQIVVEQGLTLCSGDVIKKALYAPRGDDEAISIALVIHGYTRDPALDAMNDSFNQLVTLLLEAGAVVSRTNVIMCLRYGTVSTLEVLLDYWYKGSIEANAVGFLSELTLRWGDEGFEPMLDLLLARGKDIIQVSGPGGNVFHTIIAMITKRSYQIRDINPRIRLLRERGANIKVCSFQLDFCLWSGHEQKQAGSCQLILNSAVGSTTSPFSSSRSADFYLYNTYKAPSTRGTPLQFAWRCFHSPELRSTLREELHEFMSVLVDNGADRYWREPNGAVVSMDDFLACCYLSLGQLESQSEFDHAFCRVSGDTYEYPLYATQSQIEEYTRSGGWPQ